jgi:archaellum component FlaC
MLTDGGGQEKRDATMPLLRESYERTVEDQVQALRKRVDHLSQTSQTARGHMLDELDWQLKWLEMKMDRIQLQLQALKSARKPQWSVIRREIEDLLENFWKALESASRRISH